MTEEEMIGGILNKLPQLDKLEPKELEYLAYNLIGVLELVTQRLDVDVVVAINEIRREIEEVE